MIEKNRRQHAHIWHAYIIPHDVLHLYQEHGKFVQDYNVKVWDFFPSGQQIYLDFFFWWQLKFIFTLSHLHFLFFFGPIFIDLSLTACAHSAT